jgi:hypothetical protein
MATQLKIDNQGVYFTDGTYLQTASVAWTGVSGRPTDMNQFSNASGFINTYQNCSGPGNCGNYTGVNAILGKSGTAITIYTNCQCQCQC